MYVNDLLDEIGFPYSEGEFRATPNPPYIAWDIITGTVSADGVVVYSEEAIVLYLQTLRGDNSAEITVENVLDEYMISYDKGKQWIGGSQRVWVTTYTLAAGEVTSYEQE